MARSGQQSQHEEEAARRDELQEYHELRSEKLSHGLDNCVRSVRRRSNRWTNSGRVDCILQLKICIITVAAVICGCRSQPNGTSFSFDGNVAPSDFTFLQDSLITVGQINLNSNGADKNAESRGRALYSIPVQFLGPATNSVASFQTSFSFRIFARNESSKGDGFAFGLFPDATSVGDPGKFMSTLPFVNTTSYDSITNSSNQLPSGFSHTLVIEFDTHQDVEFGDPNDNHVGVNWNSMVSLNATDLSTFGLDLVTGNITAWIEYSYPFRKLSVWMTSSALNLSRIPVLEVPDFDLSQRLVPSMYVGFAGGIGFGNNEVHTINSWTFKSSLYSEPTRNGPASSSNASSKDCGPRCVSSKLRMTIAVAVLSVGLTAGVVTIGAICLVRWRRRKAAAAQAAMDFKLKHTVQGPPLPEKTQSRTPNTRRSSLTFLNSPLASPPAKSFAPSGSSSSSYPVSPRPSFNPFTPLREPVMRRLSSRDGLRSKHSRSSSGAGSKRFTSTQELDGISSLGPRRYTYRELKQATNSFKETVGEGGFGTVYKGYLPNGLAMSVPVAVKKVGADSRQGEREFLAEVNIIAGLRHRHLVQMQGWCHEKGQLLLIYDFMENGSLDKHLHKHGEPVLSWDVRYKALCQVASALTYLHDEVEQKVIHRDVKASNVLLDSKFNARLGDFGLARLSEHSQVADTTIMAGTMGYVAPEILHTGKATTKTDVFSFGALILEVMCAKRPLDSSRPHHEALLGDWVWSLLEAGRLLDAVDSRLVENYDEIKMIRALQVGLMCLHPDPACRPPIRYALQMLVGDLALPTLPSHKPTIAFGSGTLTIPLVDLLQLSMGTIAAAMECPSETTETGAYSAEFEAPWILRMPSSDIPWEDSYFSDSLTNSVELPRREQWGDTEDRHEVSMLGSTEVRISFPAN